MAEPLAIAFEVLLGGIATLLLASYVSFVRMNPEVRRARLCVMAARIHRFLLAFTLGFFSIVLVFFVSFAGIPLPLAVSTGSVFFFLAAVLYGSIEILLIARPHLLRTSVLARANNRRGAE
ncbi:MAG TPA: hypothetical protein VGR51_08705 [Thermoplasmata archaeon]|nr:hypothetical protein [Thermoplasmata archaeon]